MKRDGEADLSAADPVVQLCAFIVAEEEYVIDIMRVEEILHLLEITRVARAPKFVEGVINLRGAILPVVDVKNQLHQVKSLHGPKQRLIICRVADLKVALKVDQVTAIFKTPRSCLKAAPLAAKVGSRAHVLGVVEHDDRLLLMLDVKALFEV